MMMLPLTAVLINSVQYTLSLGDFARMCQGLRQKGRMRSFGGALIGGRRHCGCRQNIHGGSESLRHRLRCT